MSPLWVIVTDRLLPRTLNLQRQPVIVRCNTLKHTALRDKLVALGGNLFQMNQQQPPYAQPPVEQQQYQQYQPRMPIAMVQGQPIPAGQQPIGYYATQPQPIMVEPNAQLLCQHCMQMVQPEYSTISKFSISY